MPKPSPFTPLVHAPGLPYIAQGQGSRVFVWQSDEKGAPLHAFVNGFRTAITVVNWSPDGVILVAGGSNGEILAWQVTSEIELLANRLPTSFAPVREVVCTPDHRHVAALTAGRSIQIWYVASRLCIATLGCRKHATRLVWSDDSRTLVCNDGMRWRCSGR